MAQQDEPRPLDDEVLTEVSGARWLSFNNPDSIDSPEEGAKFCAESDGGAAASVCNNAYGVKDPAGTSAGERADAIASS